MREFQVPQNVIFVALFFVEEITNFVTLSFFYEKKLMLFKSIKFNDKEGIGKKMWMAKICDNEEEENSNKQ